MRCCQKFRIFFFSAFILLAVSAPAHSAQVTLAWDPNNQEDVSGYKIYWGTSQGNYENSVDVGDVTTYVVTGLLSGQTYYFVATCYTASGTESGYSNMVSTRTPDGVPYEFSSFLNSLCDSFASDSAKPWIFHAVGVKTPGTVFKQGSKAMVFSEIIGPYGFFEIQQVWIRNGAPVMMRTTGPQYPESAWDQGHMVSWIDGINSGNWEIEFYFNTTTGGYELVDSIPFSVDNTQPYLINFSGVGLGLASGGEQYSTVLQTQKTSFKIGDKTQALIELKYVFVDHRWKIIAYRNNAQYWSWTQTSFNIIDPNWGWRYSPFTPYQTNTQAGSYRFDYYLDTGAGFIKIGSSAFTVS
jgi:hypothetical protein